MFPLPVAQGYFSLFFSNQESDFITETKKNIWQDETRCFSIIPFVRIIFCPLIVSVLLKCVFLVQSIIVPFHPFTDRETWLFKSKLVTGNLTFRNE